MVGLAYCGSGPSVELVNRNQFSGASYAKDTLAPSVDYVGVGRKSTSTGVGCISGGRTAWTNWWLPGPLTFSCYWNLITNPSGSVYIAGAQGGGGGYVLWNHYGTNRAFAVAGGVAEDGSDFITGIPALASGVYNKANVKLYDGGVLRATSGSVTADATYPSPGFMTVFCGDNGDNSAYFDGTLYWMGLWNRARSTEEESELNRYPFAFLSSGPRRIYFGAGATGGGNITFEALPSSLSLAGSLANLWANRLLTANPASFTFAGATASTLASRKVLANPSTLTMTGATGTLKWNRVFVASPGTLGFTGSVANFLLGKILTANPGSLNLTGATATVKKNSFIIADPGALSFVGQSAGLFRGRIMTADPGSLTLSGAVASLFHFRVLPADPGTLVLTGATATLAAPGTVQRARPSSDISSNGWLPSSGSDLYAMLDETSYNDSDYIYSPDNPTTQAAEVKFSAITDPGVNTGHVLRFRLAAVGQDTVFDVYLMCGATQIATWQKTVIAGVTTTYSETLTVGEAGNITDYSDLRIKVVAHA